MPVRYINQKTDEYIRRLLSKRIVEQPDKNHKYSQILEQLVFDEPNSDSNVGA